MAGRAQQRSSQPSALVLSGIWRQGDTQELARSSKSMTTPADPTTLKGAGGTAAQMRATLVLYHRDGAAVASLMRGERIVVGRAAPSNVIINDPGLSRQHARFEWDDQGIWVEDLASTNGTRRNGETITRARVTFGDEIAVGPVMVSMHVMWPTDEELRGFDSHDRFVAAFAEEVVRARTFGRPVSLVMIRAAEGKEGHVARWATRLRPMLRPVDRVGIYGPTAVFISLPESGGEAALALAKALSGGEPALIGGAVSFPTDGSSAEELITAVLAATRASKRAGRTTANPPPEPPSAVIARSEAMKEVMATVKRLARSQIAVLLQGETGTGKEVIARAIHEGGPRKKKPMRGINCGAIPTTLIESALFGHEAGAFTGADRPAKGVFEQADGSTVLLDEIGELSAGAQAALLRVLETKKLTRVGGDKEIDVDVRVIAATHRDLEAMVEAGRFREDLLYRLNPVTVRIPPLRERIDEIVPLAERFLEDASRQAQSPVRAIDADAVEALRAYGWPGNVRELRNVIERAVALAEGKTVTLADLPERVRAGEVERPEPGGGIKDQLRRYEAELILAALRKHDGNQTAAARALDMPLRTLVHKIKALGIKKFS
jgi:DNA-binding NtrC family response regulator